MTINARRWALTAVLTAGLLLAVAQPANADPVLDPGPVAPNQSFVGLVNGVTGPARIAVICDGPSGTDGPTGHAIPGQFLQARFVPGPPTADTGFTGSTGTKLEVNLIPSRGLQIELRFYLARAEIPRSTLVPCNGIGVVSFVPDPVSPTARRATVAVRFSAVLT